MPAEAHADVELHLLSRERARLVCPNRQEYGDRVQFDEEFLERLRELELEKDYRGYGRALFEAAFPAGTSLHRGLYALLDACTADGRSLRLRLNVEPGIAEELHALHWELLSDGDHFEPGRSLKVPFSRYVSLPFAVGSALPRLRLLCVIAAPTNAHRFGMASIDYDLTARRLRECFAALVGRFEVDFLERPVTPERLRSKLQEGKYHLLHIHGHGTIVAESESALVLEDDKHEVKLTSETALCDILLGLDSLKLVTLVACHGGEASVQSHQLSGLAGSLVRAGVPAVIAMRRAISMKLGLGFTAALYAQLAKDPHIDVAVNEARHRLYMENRESIDWSSPALFMRLPDGLLWQETATQSRAVPRRLRSLLQITLAALVLSFPNTYYDLYSGKLPIKLYPGVKASTPPLTPPPPPAKIEIKPIVLGSVGVGVFDRSSLSWKGDIARTLVQQVRTQYPSWKPVVIPEAYRGKLRAVLEGDLSSLPGGDKAPYGFEYLFIVAETHGDNPNKIVNFPTVNVSCEITVVATRTREILSSQSFQHTGQAGTESGALEQAFGRCVEDSLGEPSE